MESFASLERQLRATRAHPRPEFERALLQQLRAHHEALQEKRMAHWLYGFRVPRWATASFVVVLMISGSTLVGAAPAPTSTAESYAGFEASELPDFAPIRFTFDQPMMQSSVESAFTIEPQVEGQFIWNGRKEMFFLPALPLDPSITYTVTLSSDAKSLYQKSLASEISYELKPQAYGGGPLLEDSPRETLLQELRETQDRPLAPQEKKFLHHQLQELENSEALEQWKEEKKEQRLQEVKADGDPLFPPPGDYRPPLPPLNEPTMEQGSTLNSTISPDQPSNWGTTSTPPAETL